MEACVDVCAFMNPNIFTLCLYNYSKFEKDINMYSKSRYNYMRDLISISYDRNDFVSEMEISGL